MARLVDVVDGVETWFDRDKHTGQVTLYNRQNCDDVLAYNAQGRSEGWEHPTLGKHVARVPAVVYAQWVNEAGLTMQEFDSWTAKERRRFLALRLNDSDWRNLKSTDRQI